MALVPSDFYSTAYSTSASEVYVAVGNGASDSTIRTLLWAIQRFPDHKFCILHVHQTSHTIPPSDVSQEHQDMEAAILSSELDEYLRICKRSGIRAEEVYIVRDSVEKGILDHVSQHKIQKLVMGASADHKYDLQAKADSSSQAKADSSSSVNTQNISMSPLSAMNIEAVCQAKALEKLYTEEIQKRKESEAKVEMLETRNSKLLAEVADQILVCKEYEQTIKELQMKVSTYGEMVKLHEEELNEAANLVRELTDSLANSPEFFLTLPSSEVLIAASESNQSSQLLCEGELGSIYKAVLYQTDMTLRFCPAEELLVFQHEMKILSKFRHPNLASLIGVCDQDTLVLVYEHLPNGSLEDRLRCKGNTRPLSWQTRIRIAVELCSVLIFLHSHEVIHGALRPSCVLLDQNFTCKIIDFRLPQTSSSTFGYFISEYTDPEYLDTKEISPGLDLYAFGIMLLELLTGKPGFGEVENVNSALAEGNLNSLLDTSAGDWPCLQAEQLAHLGLRCCDADSCRRPDLISDVWKVLEPMRLSTGSALSLRVGEAPSYFVCPIVQEVMEDRHIAADSYTYEAEAMRQWLDRGNETSPMTNLQLGDTNLIPNKSLRSAIQEWQQLQQQ